jgi:multisubunit Na+/H+ antiporter MnhE subunit
MFGRIKRYSLLAIILLLFWIILTSNFTFFNILLGAVCSGIAALIGDYLFKGEYEPVKNALAVIARFLWYLPLLII